VTVSDTVPTNAGLSWSIDAGGTTGTWTLTAGVLSFGPVDVAPGASFHVHITSPTTSATCGTVDNSASTTSSNDGNPTVGPVAITVNCPTTVSTKLSATSISTGGSVSDQATISGGAPTAGGTITYTVYSDNTCKTPVADATPSPNTVVNGAAPASLSITFNTAGTFYWQAVYSGDPSTNTLASSSNCSDEQLVVIARQVSQITPTQTTCAQFQSGTAATLSEISYSVRDGQVSQVAPGVFFYWVKVQVATTGDQTFTITQSVSTASNFFLPAPGSFAYDGNCNTLKTTVTQSGGTTSVQFSTTAAEGAGTYFIGIKYRTSNVLGEAEPSPSTVVYTFSTTGVSGSTSQVTLVRAHSH